MTICEIQSSMSDCIDKAIITQDEVQLMSIATYHNALAIAEAMMLDSLESIPVLQEI